jgi:hypothetical protein
VKKKISEEVCKDNEKPGYFDKTLEFIDVVPPLKFPGGYASDDCVAYLLDHLGNFV